MQARDVEYAVQVVQFQSDGNKYVRLSASRNVVTRDEGTTVFANVETGVLKIASKDAEVTMVSAGGVTGTLDAPANPAAAFLGNGSGAQVSVNFHGSAMDVVDAINTFRG